MGYFSLVFILMLSLQAATYGQNHTTTEATAHNTVTAQEASSLKTTTNNTTHITQGAMVEGNAATPRNELFQPTTSTAPLQTLHTTASTSKTSQPESSTMGEGSTASSRTSMTTSAISKISQVNNTTMTGQPSTVSSSTQSHASQDTEKMPTISTSNMTTQSSTSPNTPSSISFTRPMSTESQSTSSVTNTDGLLSTGVSKTSKATTQKPLIHTTNVKDKPDNQKMTSSDGKVVAGIIGGALILMMVGFLVIFVKKRNLRRQQITTSDWAGPSPFLDGGSNNSSVTLRSSQRISLSSFLPQRLSRRLSLLQETEEEMEDMTPVSTFGNQEHTLGQEVDGDVKERNGTAVIKDETRNTEDTSKAAGESESESQTKDLLTTNNNSEDAKTSQDPPDTSMTPSATEENSPEQLGNGNGQLK